MKCCAAAHSFNEICFQVEHVTSELSLAALISSLEDSSPPEGMSELQDRLLWAIKVHEMCVSPAGDKEHLCHCRTGSV